MAAAAHLRAVLDRERAVSSMTEINVSVWTVERQDRPALFDYHGPVAAGDSAEHHYSTPDESAVRYGQSAGARVERATNA